MPAYSDRSGSHSQKPPIRRLGDIRSSISAASSSVHVPKFPPVHPPYPTKSFERNVVEGHNFGYRPPRARDGSAAGADMSLSITREEEEHLMTSSRQSSRASSTGGLTTVSQKLAKDVRELQDSQTKERFQSKKVRELTRLIEELQTDNQKKSRKIAELNDELKNQEVELSAIVEGQRRTLVETGKEMDTLKEALDEKRNYVEELKTRHEKAMEEMENSIKNRVAEALAEKDREMAEREEKYNKIKEQMSSGMGGNARERQAQIDQLTKQVSRLQDEIDSLRTKLKSFKTKQKAIDCDNCVVLSKKLTDKTKSVKSKDKQITELKSTCTNLERQMFTGSHRPSLSDHPPNSPTKKPVKCHINISVNVKPEDRSNVSSQQMPPSWPYYSDNYE